MGLRDVEKAVEALHSYVATNLQTYLTEIETERGLDAGDLAPPVAYLKHMDTKDLRSPLVLIYERNIRPASPSSSAQRQQLYVVGCNLVWSYYGGIDLDANELRMRRYIGATIRTIDADPTLSGQAIQTLFVDGDARRIEGPQKTTRHLYGIRLDVWVDGYGG